MAAKHLTKLIAALKALDPAEFVEVIDAVLGASIPPPDPAEMFWIDIDMQKRKGRDAGERYRKVYTEPDGKLRKVHIPKDSIQAVVAEARKRGLLKEGRRTRYSLPATVSPTISPYGHEESGVGVEAGYICPVCKWARQPIAERGD